MASRKNSLTNVLTNLIVPSRSVTSNGVLCQDLLSLVKASLIGKGINTKGIGKSGDKVAQAEVEAPLKVAFDRSEATL